MEIPDSVLDRYRKVSVLADRGVGGEQVNAQRARSQMEDRYPMCGIGMVDDPGTCNDGSSSGDGGGDGGNDDGPTTGLWDDENERSQLELGPTSFGSGIGFGCGAPLAPTGLLALLGFLTSARRRRSAS